MPAFASRAGVRQRGRSLVLPNPFKKQREWIAHPARNKLLRGGRRATKSRAAFLMGTEGHGPLVTHRPGVVRVPGTDDYAPVSHLLPKPEPLHRGLLQGGHVIWVALSYLQAAAIWQEEFVPRFRGAEGFTVNETFMRVDCANGGVFEIRTAKHIRTIRGAGAKLAGIILDEPAWYDLESHWLDVIAPALLDNMGWSVLTSTTNVGSDGHLDSQGQLTVPSCFNRWCEAVDRGEKPDWVHFYATAKDNPKVTIEGFDALCREYPPDSISLQQEVFAKLLPPDAGAVPFFLGPAHLCQPFEPPEWWEHAAAADWGYWHPLCCIKARIDEDGVPYIMDALFLHRKRPNEQAILLEQFLPEKARFAVAGGQDFFQRYESRQDTGQDTPTIAERYVERGIFMVPANDARVPGWQILGMHFALKDATGKEAPPRIQFVDTPGNRRLISEVNAARTKKTNPEDVEKRNADPVTGLGGDDGLEALRNLLATRFGHSGVPASTRSGFEPAVLAEEEKATRTHRSGWATKDESGNERDLLADGWDPTGLAD